MLFVCRTEVENHVLFIIENIWRLVIMARRIDMDIKILMAKMPVSYTHLRAHET